jgi:hypothetical protein
MEGCGLTATLDKRPRKKVTALLEAAFAAPTVAPDVSGVELEPDLLTLVQQAIVVLQRMAIAKKGAWKEDAAADQAIAGRVYTYNDYYGEVYSFDEAALGRKLSNYQFYAPGEYFAEAFAAYYEPTAEGRGALLAGDPALRAWFDEHVHGKATGAPGTPPR